MCLTASDEDIRAHKTFATKAPWNATLATMSVLTEDAHHPDGVGSRGSTAIEISLFALAPRMRMEVSLRGHGSKLHPLTSPPPTHRSLQRYTQVSSRPALPPQQIRQLRVIVPSMILDVKPVEKQGGTAKNCRTCYPQALDGDVAK
ncbi:hypothetical protein J1614_004306 [Plenodomus biglobosus]|nr:hypothetical protein J1614_004306 [Plenodomus biglobosus]